MSLMCIACKKRPSSRQYKFVEAICTNESSSYAPDKSVATWEEKQWRRVRDHEVGVCRRCILICHLQAIALFMLIPPLSLVVGLTIADAGFWIGGSSDSYLWPSPEGFETACLLMIPSAILLVAGHGFILLSILFPCLFILNMLTHPMGFIAGPPKSVDVECPSFQYGAKYLAHAEAVDESRRTLLELCEQDLPGEIEDFHKLFCSKLWARLSRTASPSKT